VPQLTDQEINEILGINTMPLSNRPVMNAPREIAPPGPQPTTQTTRPQNDWMSRNYRGINIDLSQEGPYEMQKELMKRSRPEDKLLFLEQQVGLGNARLADDGTALITRFDRQSGQPYEIPVISPGMTGNKAAAAMTTTASQAAGAMLGILAARRIPTPTPIVGALKEATAAALAEKTFQAAQDAGVSGSPLGEIISERAGEVPSATALNLGGAAVGKMIGKVATPFGQAVGPVQEQTSEAIEHFAKKYDESWPMTLGEKTGSKLLQRLEASLSRAPGASVKFEKIKQEKLDSFRRIQAKILEKGDPSDVAMLSRLEEDIGDDAIAVIRNNIDPVRKAALAAQDSTQAQATQAALDEFGAAAPGPPQLYPNKVGAALRARAFTDRVKFKAESNEEYGALYELPGGTDKIITPPNLIKEAEELLKKQPSQLQTTQTPTAIVGPSGQPILMTETKEVLKKEFIDPDAVKRLKSLTEPGQYSLQDLVQMRRNVRDAIEKGEALPNIDTHYMGKIEDLLTKAIDEGTKALPDNQIREAWQLANNNYRVGAERFKDRTIGRVFKEIESGGFVKDEDIVTGMGPSEYASWKKFLGEDSPEFRGLKRSVVDRLIEDSRPDASSPLLDGNKLISNLSKFALGENRSVAEDILGPERVKELIGLGKLIKATKEGPLIDYQGFTEAMARGDNLGDAVRKLAATQAKEVDLYGKGIAKDIADGKVGQNFDSTKFVDYYYDKASPKELKAIHDQLKDSPETLSELRRKVMERIFYQSQRGIAAGDTSRVGGGLFRQPHTGSLEKVIGDDQNQERLRIILGDKFEDFENLGKLLRSSEVAEQSFAGAGGFSAQMQIQQMIRGGVLSYAEDWVKQKVAAFIYSNPISRGWLGNRLLASDAGRTALMRTMIVSQPFLKAMTNDFGEDKAKVFISNLLDRVALYEERGSPQSAVLRQQPWIDQVIDKNRPRVQPITTPAAIK